jgi:hypothetical protein
MFTREERKDLLKAALFCLGLFAGAIALMTTGCASARVPDGYDADLTPGHDGQAWVCEVSEPVIVSLEDGARVESVPFDAAMDAHLFALPEHAAIDDAWWREMGRWFQALIDKARGKQPAPPTPPVQPPPPTPPAPPVTPVPDPPAQPPAPPPAQPGQPMDPKDLKAGAIWKPVSESDGKLVVLLPSKLTAAGTYARLRAEPTGPVLENPSRVAIANGDRKHSWFSKPGGRYPSGTWFTSDAGGYRYAWKVIKTASRYDGQITPERVQP